jgi:hypothetical protein
MYPPVVLIFRESKLFELGNGPRLHPPHLLFNGVMVRIQTLELVECPNVYAGIHFHAKSCLPFAIFQKQTVKFLQTTLLLFDVGKTYVDGEDES